MAENHAPPSRTGPVVAVFAHPDDAEIAAGGTLARWVGAGREVHLVVCTNGDRGSSDPTVRRADLAGVREAETRAAAEVLSLSSVRILGIPDGELENTNDVRAEVVRAIRQLDAETVLSCDPTAVFFENRYYNHADHRAAGWIALDAVFPGAGNPQYFPEQLREGLSCCDVQDIWLGWTNEPNHVQDITGDYARKIAALAEHESQLEEGIAFFEGFLEPEAVRAGAKIGVEHGEEFRVLDLS